MATKPIKVGTICPQCHHAFVAEYVDSFTTTKCTYCKYIFPIDAYGKAINNSAFYRKYRKVVAFGQDKITGKEVALDHRGNRIDPADTRYNEKDDPHGWKATGKKVKGHQRK